MKIYTAKGSRLLVLSYVKEKEKRSFMSMGINTNPVLRNSQGKQNTGFFQLLHFTATLKFEYYFFTRPNARRHEKYESELSIITEISAIIVTEYKICYHFCYKNFCSKNTSFSLSVLSCIHTCQLLRNLTKLKRQSKISE